MGVDLTRHTRPIGGGGAMEITDLEGFLADLRKVIGPTLDAQHREWEEKKPAAMEALDALGVHLTSFGGNCPVQAEGTFDGKHFYFRARYDEWQFHAADEAENVFAPSAWVVERDYGSGFDAGWMPKHEAVGFIASSVEEYRKAHP